MSFMYVASDSDREMCVYLPKRPFVRAPTRAFAAVFCRSDVRTASNFNKNKISISGLGIHR